MPYRVPGEVPAARAPDLAQAMFEQALVARFAPDGECPVVNRTVVRAVWRERYPDVTPRDPVLRRILDEAAADVS